MVGGYVPSLNQSTACVLVPYFIDRIKLLDELKDLTDNIARSEAYFTKNIDAALKVSRLLNHLW